jgi:hypothetical protein
MPPSDLADESGKFGRGAGRTCFTDEEERGVTVFVGGEGTAEERSSFPSLPRASRGSSMGSSLVGSSMGSLLGGSSMSSLLGGSSMGSSLGQRDL